MRLMSLPLNPDNMQWAAKWDALPSPGEWRQKGCKHKPPKRQQTKQAAPAKRKRATGKTANKRIGEKLSGALVLRRTRRG